MLYLGFQSCSKTELSSIFALGVHCCPVSEEKTDGAVLLMITVYAARLCFSFKAFERSVRHVTSLNVWKE